MYKRILVPIDGSDTANRGLTEALKIASEQKSQLLVLHVLSDAYLNTVLLGGILSAEVLERIHTDAEDILAAASRAAQSAGVSADTLLLEYTRQQIGEAIVKQAVEWRADLIVMGTHGRRGLDRVVMGSDAEYVLRHTPVPTLMVRA